MNARMYRYFAAATVALALGVALFADGEAPSGSVPTPMDSIESAPPLVQHASQPVEVLSEQPEPVETFTDITPDGSFGEPMVMVEGDADGESADSFGQPQMDVSPGGP